MAISMFWKEDEMALDPSNQEFFDEDDKNSDEMLYHKAGRWPEFRLLIIFGFCTGLFGILGFGLGYSLNNDGQTIAHLPGTSKRVPVEESTEIFRYNTSFAAPPPKDVYEEPIWDSMIPNGLGYVKDPSVGDSTSVLSVFHQLHCLYIVRRAYYSTAAPGSLEAFDLGKERGPHVAHCFDYLRQGILCSADSTLEPAVDSVRGFLGSGFLRQCYDFEHLKEWAEEHRAFNAHSFFAETERTAEH